jgi:uncharacterized protein (TIGR03437 family)
VRNVVIAVWIAGGLLPAVFGQCGEERWPVKIGTDADSKLVNLNNIVSSTIASLSALPAPSDLPESSRVQPTETTVFLLNATLTEFKFETDDSDYHLVLSDAAGRTMIVEIPSPNCVDAGSPFAAGIANARAEFNARFAPSDSFTTSNIPVQITGVGFFDFAHGQTGIAPNAIELHPVLDVIFNPAVSNPPTITSVNTAGGSPVIAPNCWIEIHGANLAPASVGPSGITWSGAPEFNSGRMPTELNKVTVTVDGKAAYVYFISATQINVLAPFDSSQGTVEIAVTNGTLSSAPFTATMRPVSPSFIPVPGGSTIVATHIDGSLVSSISPAKPGETIIVYGFGFGLPVAPLIAGSASQSGALPSVPSIRIGGAPAVVQYAGVISPGLYQFNVVVPSAVTNGDNPVTATYGGVSTPSGAMVAVQMPY